MSLWCYVPDLAAREDSWEVQSLIAPCEVLLVWNHNTSGWSRLMRLLLVPTEDLHLLIGFCGLWIQGRWENVTAHLAMLRRRSSVVALEIIFIPMAWQRHDMAIWQTSIRPQCYSCRPEAVIGINQPLCWPLSSCSLVHSSKFLVVCGGVPPRRVLLVSSWPMVACCVSFAGFILEE